jgi:hypothetical protein
MTAEAAVMNRLGVALAADSAVSASVAANADKIYSSSDKLFQLARRAPVGVLVYGNADLVGMPWETIIKGFRDDLGDTRFPHVVKYANALLSYIARSSKLFPIGEQRVHVGLLVDSLFLSLRGLAQAARQRKSPPSASALDILEEAVNQSLQDARSTDLLPILGPKAQQQVRRRYGDLVKEATKRVFDDLHPRRRTETLLQELAYQVLVRAFFGPMQSGVVVAGFGDQEYTPSLYQFIIEEMVLGKPRAALVDAASIGSRNRSSVHTFAQDDPAHAFMEGIDRNLNDYMTQTTRDVLSGLSTVVADIVAKRSPRIGNALRIPLRHELDRLGNELLGKWTERRRLYWEPVVRIVSVLPKDELASMAEALVNLTKFRHRVTPASESVGGPIDVAIITKGDGFVWAKRKHYFDPALNPRVIARIRREG